MILRKKQITRVVRFHEVFLVLELYVVHINDEVWELGLVLNDWVCVTAGLHAWVTFDSIDWRSERLEDWRLNLDVRWAIAGILQSSPKKWPYHYSHSVRNIRNFWINGKQASLRLRQPWKGRSGLGTPSVIRNSCRLSFWTKI